MINLKQHIIHVGTNLGYRGIENESIPVMSSAELWSFHDLFFYFMDKLFILCRFWIRYCLKDYPLSMKPSFAHKVPSAS